MLDVPGSGTYSYIAALTVKLIWDNIHQLRGSSADLMPTWGFVVVPCFPYKSSIRLAIQKCCQKDVGEMGPYKNSFPLYLGSMRYDQGYVGTCEFKFRDYGSLLPLLRADFISSLEQDFKDFGGQH